MQIRTLYAAKCYWPGVTARQLEQASARAAAEAEAASRAGSTIAYLGSIVFPDDELALCLFDAASRAVVRATTERAGMPCERLMYSHWLPWARAAATTRDDGQPPPPAHRP